MANVPKKPATKAAPRAPKLAAPASELTSALITPAPIDPPEAADVPEEVLSAGAFEAEAETMETPIVKDLVVEEPIVEKMIDEPRPVLDAPTDMQEGTYGMSDVIETGKKIAADAKAKVESVVADLNEKAKVAAEKSARLLEEMTDLTKGNVEALVESSRIAAKGVETFGQGAAEYGRRQFEQNSATMKSFASVKSPAEFFQLQSELLSSSFDAFASETSKNSEAMLKLAGDIVQPISTRVSVVTDKVKALAA